MNPTPPITDSIGYLIVKVSTARGAIPLENATVNIRGGEKETSGVLHSLRTNRDGQTERIALPTPPRSASQSPSDTPPYATYAIDVFLDGYIPLAFDTVPVFPAVLSIQPAVMVPQPEFAGVVPPDLYPSVSIPSEDERGAL